ncbi:N-acetylglucosaminyldiphosphoundecaprenol N-acetyl-beta-D-mannosaminyltransferase [Alteripontixanthobacter maritimus]|uniref:N-acetylglucosaminyldiphosphoundecaprenol N-acetyl-beta-D-mannosaminyltransferase n=1 Tax=Alteripontixanthobacter maritimus TaxID=2161824 RepID=A0A369Q9V5_9SPHN|nr:WecB/TagA/CpsF family glycosyltransferase [Alteripontixanthobacter maritimus]RDC59689.1 N-acetylglucosaminyldiphosphoundecaprenol N-acetyl-beta-D-mannosaminyltransferase [Alteripontixanthobacter maritimus]
MTRRIRFFDTPVDLLTMDQTVARAEAAMSARDTDPASPPVRHTALNVAKLIKLDKDPELAADVRGSDIIGIDGMGIVLGLKMFGVDGAQRVPGVDLFLELLAHCARTGRRPYILGAKQSQLDAAIIEAKRRFPGLEFAGSRHGYFAQEDESEIVTGIRESGADCLFVAMPTPHKERFLNRNASKLRVPFIMGVGGSVDVLAGHVSRAPEWMQQAGLEWFHRMVKEPRKMVGRYASTNSAFAMLLLKTRLSGRNPISS